MKRILTILVPLLALGGLIGWRLTEKKRAEAEQTRTAQARKNTPPGVRVAAAVRRDIVHRFEGIGSAESPFNVRVSSQVAGRIAFLEVREGTAVRQGDVLARIDPAEIQAQVSRQQANLAEAQSRLAQATLMAGTNDVTVNSQILQQRAAVNSARSSVNQAEKNYDSQVAAARALVTDAQGRIDSAEAAIRNAQAAIKSSQANLANANVRFDRASTLFAKGFIAQQNLDDARTQVQIQKSAVEVANGQLASAQALRDSAMAQKRSAQEQADIAAVKGDADIQAARAVLQQAEAALTAARANTAQKSAYQQNLAALRAVVDAAAAQLRNAQVQLSQTTLRAPLSGYVTARYVDPGMVIGMGQAIVALQTTRQIYVTISVPEDISRSIYPGLTATCVFDALPGRTFTGKVTQVNPAIDIQSRQFVVRITVDNAENLIRPGMFARATLEIGRTRDAVVVPREAIRKSKEGLTVAVVDADNIAHIRVVQTGDSDAAGTAVTEGLQAGEQVVRLSLAPVKDGQKVRVDEGAPSEIRQTAVQAAERITQRIGQR